MATKKEIAQDQIQEYKRVHRVVKDLFKRAERRSRQLAIEMLDAEGLMEQAWSERHEKIARRALVQALDEIRAEGRRS